MVSPWGRPQTVSVQRLRITCKCSVTMVYLTHEHVMVLTTAACRTWKDSIVLRLIMTSLYSSPSHPPLPLTMQDSSWTSHATRSSPILIPPLVSITRGPGERSMLNIQASLHVVSPLSLFVTVKCNLGLLLFWDGALTWVTQTWKKASCPLRQKFLALMSRRAPGSVIAVSWENVSQVTGVKWGSCFTF